MRRPTPWLLWTVLALMACAGGPEEDSGDDTEILCEPGPLQRVIGGSTTDGFEAVVSVNEVASSFCARTGITVCTGTVIGPRTVLTAAHCQKTVPDELMGVVFGSQSLYGEGPVGDQLDGIWFQPTDVEPHPAYDPDSGANDLMLMHFAEDLPATPMPLAAVDSTLVGGAATVVGFGGAADGEAFVKQEGTVQVESVSDDTLRYGPDPAMTCVGDSGGPVLLATTDGYELAGVTVRGDAACTTYGDALRVDAYASFLGTR